MVLYRITLVPLAEVLRAADSGFLSPFYVDDAAFGGLERRSAHLLKLLMKRGTNMGYLPEPDKSLFISDASGQEDVAKGGFAKEGLDLNFMSASRYLRSYLSPQKELEAWIKPQVEAWAHGVRV